MSRRGKNIEGVNDHKKARAQKKVEIYDEQQLHKKKKIYQSIAIVILFILAIVAYYVINNGNKYGLVLNKKITTSSAAKVTISNDDSIVTTYSDKLIVYEKGKIKAYNTKGSLVYENKVENIYSPTIETDGTFIQLVNNTTGDIFIFDDKYQVGTISLEKEIISSKITEEGVSLVHYKALGTKSALGIFNKNGKELYKVNLETNLVSDYMYIKGGKYLIYVEPNTSGISIVSNVYMVDLKSADKAIECIISKENEIIFDIEEKGSNINILTDSRVVSYNLQTKTTTEENISKYSPENIAISGGKYVYINEDEENVNNTNCIIRKLGQEKFKTVSFVGKQKYFKVSDEIIIVGLEDSIYLYSMYGRMIKEITATDVITEPRLFNNGKNMYMIVSNNILIFDV